MKMKYFSFILSILILAGCATIPKEVGLRVDERTYQLTYNLNAAQNPRILSDIVFHGARLTLKAGYEKFVFFQDEDVVDQALIIIYMYNANEDVPWDLISFEEFDAVEYSKKKYVPLGLYHNAS